MVVIQHEHQIHSGQILYCRVSKRNQIFRRDGYRCLKCGQRANLTIDHVIPRSKGGSNGLKNMQTLCKSCNKVKNDNFADYRGNVVETAYYKDYYEIIGL